VRGSVRRWDAGEQRLSHGAASSGDTDLDKPSLIWASVSPSVKEWPVPDLQVPSSGHFGCDLLGEEASQRTDSIVDLSPVPQ
jgi:hypothetical protein